MNTNPRIAPIVASVTQPEDLAPRYEHVGLVPVALGVLRQSPDRICHHDCNRRKRVGASGIDESA
jgi:hypothetical protein